SGVVDGGDLRMPDEEAGQRRGVVVLGMDPQGECLEAAGEQEPGVRVQAAAVVVASRRALTCTSGRSITASTRLARQPGGTCPGTARSQTRAVPAASSPVITSAVAIV